MIKQVVIGVDGSEFGFTAFEYGLDLASSLGCELKVVHVMDSRKFDFPMIYQANSLITTYQVYVPPQKEIEELYAKVKKDFEIFAGNCINACEKKSRERGMEIATTVREGIPASILMEESVSGDLLVLGKKGEHAKWDRRIAGSTTEEIIHSCYRPVLVCSKTFKKPERLLFPYDGSMSAENGIQFLVNAFPALWKEVFFLILNREYEEDRFIEKELTFLNKHGIAATLLKEDGAPEEVIRKTIEKERIDLLLLGAHGNHPIKEALLGSRAAHLIRVSPVPVLVVF